MATVDDQEFVLLGEDDVQDFNYEGTLPLTDKEKARIEKWLAPTDYAAISSEWGKHRASHLSGTGAWITETDQYQQWHDDPDKGGLWIKAVAGAGKSVIAATIVSKLAEEEKAPVLYFFFRNIVSANQRPVSLARDFLSQILQYSPRLQHDLFELIDRDRTPLDSMSLNGLWNMLVSALAQMPRAYCIIDALDEMDVEHETFLSDLVTLSLKRPRSIKVLMTSRPLPRIEQYIRNTHILQLLLQPQLVNPDISTYIQHRLTKSPLSSNMRSKVHETLYMKADGHFLYARLMIDDILDIAKSTAPDPQRVLEALDELPIPMAGMYTRMLLEHSRRSLTPQELQVMILQWVTRAERPLRLLELSSLIDTKQFVFQVFKDAKSVIREACGPLLEIFEDETVHPIHHSFTEYLYDDSRRDLDQEALRFPVLSYEEAQRILALRCLEHLVSGWHVQWVIPPTKARSNTAINVLSRDRDTLKLKYPYLAYTTKNWKHHLYKSGSNDSYILKALQKMFTDDRELLRAWLSWELGGEPDDDKWSLWSPLHAAANEGILFFVKVLLQLGHKADEPTSDQHTPLSLAAKNGHDEVVETLLAHGVRPDEPDDAGLKPLHHAACLNHWKVVQILLEAGVDPFTGKTKAHPGRRCGAVPSSIGVTPVEYACYYGHLESMQVLVPFLKGENLQHALSWALSYGRTQISIEVLQHPDIDVNYYIKDKTPLWLAARNQDLRTIRMLLEKGADATLLSSDRVSHVGAPAGLDSNPRHLNPIHEFAPRSQHAEDNAATLLEGFSMLLEAGVNPNVVDGNGYTILHILMKQNYPQYPMTKVGKDYLKPVLAFLFAQGLSPTAQTKNGSNALHLAINVSLDVVDMLLEHGLDVDTPRISDGKTPLMIASTNMNMTLMQYLLQKGANANFSDHKGNTPLHHVGQLHSFSLGVEPAQALIAAGANVNSRNQNGNTALHSVLFKPELTRTLLQHGFDLEAKNKLGRTVLFAAISSSSPIGSCIKLVELGSDPLTKDESGRTVLHAVLQSISSVGTETLDLVRFFVEKGVDPQSIDLQGNNLWHVLAAHGADSHQEEQLALMNLLMTYGVPLTKPNHSGRTPLHIAFAVDRNDYRYGPVEFLCEHMEVDFELADYDRVCPLHLASSFDLKSTCFLLERGVDCTATTIEGQTALMIACRTRQCDIVCALLHHYRRNDLLHLINQADNTGQTALHYACRSGRPETVAMLLDTGADTNVRDNAHSTPLHACAAYLKEDATWTPSARAPPADLRNSIRARYVLSTDSSRPTCSRLGDDPIRVRETIRLLVNHGADTSFLTGIEHTNAHDGQDNHIDPYHMQYHRSPLAIAIANGCNQMVSELLLIKQRLLREKAASDLLTIERHFMGDELLEGNTNTMKIWPNEIKGFAHKMGLLKMQYSPDVIADSVIIGENNCRLVQDVLRDDEEPGVRHIAEAGARFELLDHYGDSVPKKFASWGYADLLDEFKKDAAHMTAAWTKEMAPQNSNWSEGRLHSILSTALERTIPNMAVVKTVVSKLQHDVNETFFNRVYKPIIHTYAHRLAAPMHWWQTEALTYLLNNGANVEQLNSIGETPLITTLNHCQDKHQPVLVRTLEILLNHGANPNAVDKDGQTCLNLAAKMPKYARLLLKHGANPSLGQRPFLPDVIDAQDIEMIKYVVASGADLNQVSQILVDYQDVVTDNGSRYRTPAPRYSRGDVKGWSTSTSLKSLRDYAYPVHMAASDPFNTPKMIDKASEIVRVLLTGGANPSLKYQDGSTILHCLMRTGGIFEPFLSLPSLDTELRDGEGRTLLLNACTWHGLSRAGKEWVYHAYGAVPALLSRGASMTAVDDKGRNALHYLINTVPMVDSYWEPIRSVIQPFVSVLALKVDSQNRTAYHYAVARRHIDLVQLLLENNADPTIADPADNTTALHHLAAKFSLRDVLLDPEVQSYMETRTLPMNQLHWRKLQVCSFISRFVDEPTREEREAADRRSPRRLFTLLLTRGLDINHKDSNGETPLFRLTETAAGAACWMGAEDDAGLKISVGMTLSTLQNMEREGADLVVRNNIGESVLHKLAKHSDRGECKFSMDEVDAAQGRKKDLQESFKWLVSKGLDVMWEDVEQRTCLDVAAVSGATWMMELFQRN